MRTSGILMPVFSLASPYGIGTLGKAAFDFIDFLHKAKSSYADDKNTMAEDSLKEE